MLWLEVEHSIHCIQHDVWASSQICRHVLNFQVLSGFYAYGVTQGCRQAGSVPDVSS